MLTLSDLTCPPLYGTDRSPDRPTFGPKVGKIAAMLGKPYMPHQQFMADVALEIDPETGRRVYSKILLVGPRQGTGKTEWLLPIMTHRCTGWGHIGGSQRVLYLAQTADDAKAKWRDVHEPRLASSPLIRGMFHQRKRTGTEAFLWEDGSIWMPGANTPGKAGTGDSLDLGVIDEAWAHANARVALGLRPAMLTRHNSQLIIASMIPGITRKLPNEWAYLKHEIQIAKAKVEAGVRSGTAVFIYGARPGLDPADPDTWWSAIPGLGITVLPESVANDQADMDPVDFGAEYLSWIPEDIKPRWTLIQELVWDGLKDTESEIIGPPAMAIVMDEHRQTAVIVAAGYNADGRMHNEIVEPGDQVIDPVGVDWVLERALEIDRKQKPYTWVIDPRRSEASLIEKLRRERIPVITPNVLEVAAAHGRWYDYTGNETPAVPPEDAPLRLAHLGQTELSRAVAVVVKLDSGSGGFTFVKRGTDRVLIHVYGCVLATHGYEMTAPPLGSGADGIDASRPCGVCGRSVYLVDDGWLHASDDTPEC